MQELEIWTLDENMEKKLIERSIPCKFVPLIGKFGWK